MCIHACGIDFNLFEFHILPSSTVSADICPLSNAGVPTSVADADFVKWSHPRGVLARRATHGARPVGLGVDGRDGALMTNFTMGGLGLHNNNVIDVEN